MEYSCIKLKIHYTVSYIAPLKADLNAKLKVTHHIPCPSICWPKFWVFPLE